MSKDVDYEDLALHCGSPGCMREIRGGRVAYDEEREEVYHPDDCARQATIIRAFQSKSVEFQGLKYIPFEEAIRLLKEGKLVQAEES